MSLTFDGGTLAQFDALRLLADLGIRSTLYLDAPTFLDHLAASRDLANEGIELGNLALHGATDDDGLIARMPPETVLDEVESMKRLLLGMFDRRHSAALPLVKVLTGESGLPVIPQIIHRSIVRLNDDLVGNVLRERYDTIRTHRDGFNEAVAQRELACYRGDCMDAVGLGLVTQIAHSQGSWLVLSFGPKADLEPVQMFARWLVRQRIWIAPVIEVADWLAAAQQPHPTYDSV